MQDSSVFHRHSRSHPPRIQSGSGCILTDENGKEYLDASGGAAVSCLGHGDKEVIAAIKAQLDRIAYAHTGFFTSDPAEELADKLVEKAPEGLTKVYFVSGGSEAVESALKLARQYQVERGQPQRTKLIARAQSYHGNTLGALAAGGNTWRRAMFEPLLSEVSHIPTTYAYRHQKTGESAEEYGKRAANELETEILRLGADKVFAFIAETVGGATAGALVPPPGYFKRIREICDQYGVVLILDEVMCGIGRTGRLFACEEDGVSPDILCIAKGLGGGYQPIGAMLASQEIYATIAKGTGFFQHGHTYLAHATACAGSLAVLNAIEDRNLVEQVRARGAYLRSALEKAFGQHENVGDIRGRGLFQALELVEDRDQKTPLDPKRAVAAKFKKAAFEAGLICYPMGGTIDGKSGDHVLLAPPFIISEQEIDEVVRRLEIALADALAG